MKLGMLLPEFPVQTQIFFWREIEALKQQGHEVSILSTARPKEGCPHAFAREAEQLTYYLFPPHLSDVTRGLLAARGLPKLRDYIDSLSPGWRAKALGFAACAVGLVSYAKRHGIEHLHSHSCASAAHVAAMAYLLGGPTYSLHLHGDLWVYGTDHEQKMRNALFVATAADVHRQQVVDGAKLPKERTVCMKMGVDVSRFPPPQPRTTTGPLKMLSVSRLAACKGHRFALRAMRRAVEQGADIHYTIAGAGPDRDLIEQEVEYAGLKDRVKLVGAVSEEGVSQLLREADVFVLSSAGYGEASPVAVMEAMTSGVPIICSIIGGTPDMITDGVEGYLVPMCDVPGLTEAMLKSHNDRAKLQTMGLAARARAEREFDSHLLASNFIRTLEQYRSAGAKRVAA